MKSENIGWFFVYFKSEAAANRFMLDDTLEVSKNNFVSTTSFLAYANFIDRFKDDHIYIDMDDCFYLQDGVVLNCFGKIFMGLLLVLNLIKEAKLLSLIQIRPVKNLFIIFLIQNILCCLQVYIFYQKFCRKIIYNIH